MNNKIIRKVSESNGQYKVTIPKVIVQIMRLSNKDKVEISVKEDSIVISKV